MDEGLIGRMVDYAKVCEEDDVLDLGAGLGFLTEALASKARRVYAVEVDSRLLEVLRKRLAPYHNVSIVAGDAMRIRLPTVDKVVSNPPYSISSALFLRRPVDFRLGVVTLQREFVERLTAKPRSPDYGRVSVVARLNWRIERLEALPRSVFQPLPRVDSCLVKLTKVGRSPDPMVDDGRFLDLLTFLFSGRRRTLGKVLKKYFELRRIPRKAEEVVEDADFLRLRVCELEPEVFFALARELARPKDRKSLREV